MKSLFFVFLAVACLNFASMAQTVSVQPSVSVIGEAEMTISPNQIAFTFEVVTTDPMIAAAKRANDAASAKTLSVAKSFNIPNDDLQTDRLTISPRYAGEKTRGVKEP